MHSDFALEIAGVWARAATDSYAGDPAAFAASVVRVANEVQRGLSAEEVTSSAASAAPQSELPEPLPEPLQLDPLSGRCAGFHAKTGRAGAV